MEISNEESFGAITVKYDSGDLLVLIIKHTGGFWGFPKGHPNLAESPEDTAERETFEETGIRIKVRGYPTFIETYSYQNNGINTCKQVTYFVSEYASGEIGSFDVIEIEQCLWVTLEQAVELLSFESSKKILFAVFDLITSNKLSDNLKVD